MRYFVLFLTFIAVGVNAITSMASMPGFAAMRRCAQWPLSFGVKYDMKCDNDICFCNRFPEALTRLINSVSTSSCSGTDIDSATNMLSAFCRQVPSLTYHFDTPVQTDAGVSTPAGAGATTPAITAAPGNSVVTSVATTTFTTTDSKGQASVVTLVVTTTRSNPAFKSSATRQSIGSIPLVATACLVLLCLEQLWL